MPKTKALVMLSGGLDSMLAVKVLQAQNIEVEALSFVSNFYDAQKAEAAAKFLDIKLHKVDIKKEMLELVKNPPNGYGKNLNPCVDCHGMMFRIAGEYIKNKDATSPTPPGHPLPKGDFLATGEVLGQRPFSQNKQALLQVQKLAGVDVLRPLSAKLLPETEMEKERLVNRGRLLNIQGRSRDRQMELAEKYGIKEYPSPAGGCLLTDPGFSERLGKMLDNWLECGADDVELLKYGRVFWLKYDKKNILTVIGRHQEDNEMLEKLVKKGDFMVKLKDRNGPSTLVRNKNHELEITNLNERAFLIPENISDIDINQDFFNQEELLAAIGKLTGCYATKLRGREAEFEIKKT